MNRKKSFISFIKYLLSALFIAYLAGITLFTHSHVVNGVTIVHSHPFNKDAEHRHTATGFQLIEHLSHIVATGEPVFPVSLLFISLFICVLSVKPLSAKRVSPVGGMISLRAPPVYC